MRAHFMSLGLVALIAIAGDAPAQSVELTSFIFRKPAPCDVCNSPVSGPVSLTPTDPSKKDQAPATDSQAFAQAPAAGGEAGPTFNPAMFGDLGASGVGRVTVRSQVVTFVTVTNGISPPFTTTTIPVVRNVDRTVYVPIVGHGSFKISDNESPRPTDRVFFTYNYYDGVATGTSTFGLNRELIGFEKTFLGGDASFGMRLPFLQTGGAAPFDGFPTNEVGELSLITKYAFINNAETGNVVSGGLALTLPTANHNVVLADGSALRSVLFQPYSGWILNFGNLYAHGFHSIVVPTDSRDITEINNDIGIGYFLARNPDGFLRGIVPTIEGHLYTPLNHRNNSDVITAFDILTFTAAVNVVLPGNSTLGVGVATPVTGPRPNNVEALVSFNFRF